MGSQGVVCAAGVEASEHKRCEAKFSQASTRSTGVSEGGDVASFALYTPLTTINGQSQWKAPPMERVTVSTG